MSFSANLSSSQLSSQFVNPKAMDDSKKNHGFKDELNNMIKDLSIEKQVTSVEKNPEEIKNEIIQLIKTAKNLKHDTIFEEYSKQLMSAIQTLISILKKTKSKKTNASILDVLNELDPTTFKSQYKFLKQELTQL